MANGAAKSLDRGARWSALLGLLAERGRLSVGEVVDVLGVSEATVRRDFGDLAAQQLVTRTHGGIVATAVAWKTRSAAWTLLVGMGLLMALRSI